MPFNKSLWSSASGDWATPAEYYQEIDKEFHFTYDPCPLYGSGGLTDTKWVGRVYVNPPYGRGIGEWVQKGFDQSLMHYCELVVMLLPARTDTKWFHEIILPNAKEIRFIKGRLKFGGSKNSAPFPSMLVIFKHE